MGKGNKENLKPFDKLTVEQQRKIASKGGKASAAKAKEKKTMKEMLDYLLTKEVTNNKGEKATTLEAMMSAAAKKAISGDIKACEFVRDTIGQKPTDKHEFEAKGLQVVVASEADKKLLEGL